MKVKELLKKHNLNLNLIPELMEIEFGDNNYTYQLEKNRNEIIHTFEYKYNNCFGEAIHIIHINENNMEINTELYLPKYGSEYTKYNEDTIHLFS